MITLDLPVQAKLEKHQKDDEIDAKPRWKEESRAIEFSPAPVVRPTFLVKVAIHDTPPSSQCKGKSPALGTADQQAKLESILAAAKQDSPSCKASGTTKVREGSGTACQVSTGDRQNDRHSKKRRLTSEELKDQHLKMLIKELVIRNMSKFKQEINDRDTFKKHAKEVRVFAKHEVASPLTYGYHLESVCRFALSKRTTKRFVLQFVLSVAH